MDFLISEKTKLPVPTVPFESFYVNYKDVKHLIKTPEWKKIYSHYYEFTEFEEDIDFSETLEDFNNYSPERQRQELIKCIQSFPYFAQKYLQIMHPIHGSIRFLLYKYQKRVIDYYETNRFNMVSKFRQGGLTTLSVLWGLWKCLFRNQQQIMIISKTDREAITAGEIVDHALDYLPFWIYNKKITDQVKNKHEKQFADTKSIMRFHTPEAARGKSITFLIIDEAAFIVDMERHYKAIYPVIATGGSCCVVSTVNGVGNWYADTYFKAQDGNSYFKIIDLDYWEHPLYANPIWAKETRANMGEKAWLQEVERSFLGSGSTYINSSIIRELERRTKDNLPLRMKFDKWIRASREDAKIDWDEGALWIWKEPIDGHEYIIAADSAEGVGESGDNSCFEVLDMSTLEQVAEFYSNTVPPHIFAQILNETGYYYNTALIVVENMESGIAVLGSLQNDLAYENLYSDGKKKDQKPGIKLDRMNRPQCLEALQHRLITDTVKINSRRLVSELNTFIFNPVTKRAQAAKGKHDDAVISLALAIFIRDTQIREVPIGSDTPEELLKIFKSQVYEEIKKEIREGSPEDWLNEGEETFSIEEEDWLPFNIRRKNEKLLREFEW